MEVDYSELKIPNHVAFIVDGNGRWATERGKNRSFGHEVGFKNLMKILSYAFSKNIKYFSAYLFSTENFKRSKVEVSFLMNLFTGKLNEILSFCHDEKIKVIFSGRRDRLSLRVVSAMEQIEEETSIYEDRIFNICFNYGGRAEIVDAALEIAEEIKRGELFEAMVDEDVFGEHLYQKLPDVDLMIRTSGEERLSNFMLWQCSYAEFYFPKVYFPDFDEGEFDKAILEYTRRDRRFGGIDYENKGD